MAITKSTKPKSAKAAAQAYLKSHRFDGLAKCTMSSVTHYMGKFMDYFGDTDLDSISPEELLKSTPKHWGPVSRSNYLRVVRTFCGWARDNDYLPHDRRTVGERTKTPKIPASDPTFFTPEECRRLLRVSSMLVGSSDEWLFSMLVLGGFVGIRTSEITRLSWGDIDLTRKVIRMTTSITKTGVRRMAEIPDNAVEWLRHMEGRAGKVIPQKVLANMSRALCLLSKEAGVVWKKNALRHSYVTYAMARERNAWTVAEQVGNSPRVLQAHYKGLVLPTDADEWFGITPDNTL